MTCIADDITECDCDACREAEDRWEREQGWHDDGNDDGNDGPGGCVLGAECLVADPFHDPSECFDVEMAKQYMGEDDA